MGSSMVSESFLAQRLAAAAIGDIWALYDLGIAYSCGAGGLPVDLIQAHKWFNLAASRGHEEAASFRADVAEDMTAREIAEAQKQARAWIAETQRLAA